MKNKQSLGIILFAIALLINRFLPANNLLDFIAGFLTGLSIVFNFYSFKTKIKLLIKITGSVDVPVIFL